MRIVSLIGSATEIVCALGLRDQLVGRSHECDYPLSILDLPKLTEPKIVGSAPSGEIDRGVKALVREGLSVFKVDAERLKALKPDLIITQTQCKVCAVSLQDVEAAVCEWIGDETEILSLEPKGMADFWRDIRRVAEACGVPDRGRELEAGLKGRMEPIAREARGLNPKPTVASLLWIEPLMATGNWMPELIEMAGGINLFGEAGKYSPAMRWEDLVAKDPDIVLAVPCGFDIPRTRQEMNRLTTKPAWPRLKAVRNRRVYAGDGVQYFNRPGPRLVDIQELTICIYFTT